MTQSFQVIQLPQTARGAYKRRDIKGDRPNYRGSNRFGLAYGNGCALGGDDCFSCPLPDCKYSGTKIAGTNINYQGRNKK